MTWLGFSFAGATLVVAQDGNGQFSGRDCSGHDRRQQTAGPGGSQDGAGLGPAAGGGQAASADHGMAALVGPGQAGPGHGAEAQTAAG
jgi:hypothetical protein